MNLPEPKRLPDGRWTARYSAPPGADGKRRQPRVYGRTKKECTEALVAAVGQVHAGRPVDDPPDQVRRAPRAAVAAVGVRRATSSRPRWSLTGRPSRCTWPRACGHLRVVDLRDTHFRDLAAAMRLINRPEADDGPVGPPAPPPRRQGDEGRAADQHPAADRQPYPPGARGRVVVAGRPGAAHARGQPGRRGEGRQGAEGQAAAVDRARIERWQETGQIPGRVMVWSPRAVRRVPRRHRGRAAVLAVPRRRVLRPAALRAAPACAGPTSTSPPGASTSGRPRSTTSSTPPSRRTPSASSSSTRTRPTCCGRGARSQLAERIAWAGAWTDSGRVFTREDGTALRPAHVSERFDTLVSRLGLPPVTLHGLRHGSATMALAAGVPIKAISEMLGHATIAFHRRRLHRGRRGARRGRRGGHRGVYPAACQDCAKRRRK